LKIILIKNLRIAIGDRPHQAASRACRAIV
jgi:hypothetical protein